MPVRSRGVRDPVEDHGACCEQPELWRYFRPEAEARMLSALGAIFRVDPVETEFLLDLASWTATEAAVPVLRGMLDSRDLSPKLAHRVRLLLGRLAPEPDTIDADDAPGRLLERLRSEESPSARAALVEALARSATGPGVADRFAAACELLEEGHPDGFRLVAAHVRGLERSGLTEEQRSQALLACAASGSNEALALVVELLARDAGLDAADLYEAAKALASRPPPALDAKTRRALADAMRARLARHPQLALVIDAMLLGPEAARTVRRALWRLRLIPGTRTDRATLRRSIAEAAGWLPSEAGVPILRRLLGGAVPSLRAETLLSLRRIGTPAAARAALAGVRPVAHALRPAVDMDAAFALHVAVDLAERAGDARAAPTLLRIQRGRAFDAHGVGARASLALAALDDARCLEVHPASGLPHLVHALLTPQPVTPGRGRAAEEASFRRGVRWLEVRWGLPLLPPPPPEGPPTGHLRRVHASRRILAALDAGHRSG